MGSQSNLPIMRNFGDNPKKLRIISRDNVLTELPSRLFLAVILGRFRRLFYDKCPITHYCLLPLLLIGLNHTISQSIRHVTLKVHEKWIILGVAVVFGCERVVSCPRASFQVVCWWILRANSRVRDSFNAVARDLRQFIL